MSVARYMALALGHPVHGYYATRDPFGVEGDFTTAPEISQMFGELIGLWAAEAWVLLGCPAPIALVELGPGRGTLMADALRAARVVPGFLSALSIHLVETSPVLRERQRDAMQAIARPVTWHGSLDEVPACPSIVIANEFLDALPVRQFVRSSAGWHERVVGLTPDGLLAFGIAAEPHARAAVCGAQPGDVLEYGEAGISVMSTLARRLVAERGAALLIDYGHARTGVGDTLQAVKEHRFTDPLAEPGEADLTAHVDFASLARTARIAGAAVSEIVEQGSFLEALGIGTRASRLKERAGAAGRAAVDAALTRLTARDPPGMGRLFKVLGLAGPGLRHLPGLRLSDGTGNRRQGSSITAVEPARPTC